eukprot:SAG31_NODE_3734_length_3939_cov_1.703906_4_plen_149_part_00
MMRAYLNAEPDSRLARCFRLFVRHAMLPCMQAVVDLLKVHGAVVEFPPSDWLKSAFPDDRWHSALPTFYRNHFIARTASWTVLMAAWEGGDYTSAIPTGTVMFPFSGLKKLVNWSIGRGEERQAELIGACANSCTRTNRAHASFAMPS